MKLEVGMYVRTLKGIVKIDEIKDGVMWDTQGHVHFGDFIKSKHNIIDLIEVGDYVNGHEIKSIDTIQKVNEGEVKLVRFARELGCYFTNNEIKSIVTKEQFEQIQYKVGE